MANKDLFTSKRGAIAPPTNTVNDAGGRAYELSAKQALALFVSTGCLNGTFYASAKTQFDNVRVLLPQVEPEFLAKLAIYAHEKTFMKDLPALLVTYLASDNGIGGGATTELQNRKLNALRKSFHRVITNGTMLRNFFQMMRSAAFGRKSFGVVPRQMIRDWFNKKSPSGIFFQSIGNNPSLKDIIKLVKPKPNSSEKAAVLSYLLGAKEVIGENGQKQLIRQFFDKKENVVKVASSHPYENLPSIIKEFENWKKDKSLPVPAINFRFLDNEKLSTVQWADIALKANWLTTIKNLNAYAEHGVFDVKGMTDLIAERIGNQEEVRNSKVFPYQIMMAYFATSQENKVPMKIQNALQDAMEVACENVPLLGKVKFFPDVSGSMSNPVTGNRGTATSKVRCIDVAALFAVAMLRRNPDAEVIPFAEKVVNLSLNPRDSIVTNAKKLAEVGGGGTNCSAPLAFLNQKKDFSADVLIYISDYESWVDKGGYSSIGTLLLEEWNLYKSRNKKAKLICIDLTPRSNHQIKEQQDILQIGGWSDNAFLVIDKFIRGGWNKDFWIQEIEAVKLDVPAEETSE